MFFSILILLLSRPAVLVATAVAVSLPTFFLIVLFICLFVCLFFGEADKIRMYVKVV